MHQRFLSESFLQHMLNQAKDNHGQFYDENYPLAIRHFEDAGICQWGVLEVVNESVKYKIMIDGGHPRLVFYMGISHKDYSDHTRYIEFFYENGIWQFVQSSKDIYDNLGKRDESD